MPIDIVEVVADGEIDRAVHRRMIDLLRGDDPVHAAKRAAQCDLIARQHTCRAKKGKGIHIRPVHDDRDAHRRIRMKIIDPVDQLSRRKHRRAHLRHEETRALLCHVDALIHLPRVKVADLCHFADVQVVRTRCRRSPTRHEDRREIRLRLKDNGNLLWLCSVIQMIVEDARIPRHRIAVEDAALLDILGAVREEQRAARVVGLHRPTMHEMRCPRCKHAVARRLRTAEDARNAVTDVRLCRTALTHDCAALIMLCCIDLSRRTDKSERCRRHFLNHSLIHIPFLHSLQFFMYFLAVRPAVVRFPRARPQEAPKYARETARQHPPS